MLNSRVETFIEVYKNKSYTKAAEKLCITQPAVTQHIKSLEKHYDCKLITYTNREVSYTKSGELFYQYAVNAKVNEQVIMQKFEEIKNGNKKLKFAATLTIGEFTLPPLLGNFMSNFTEYSITMYVDNTKKVLQMLRNAEIHFALVEGLFDKSEYETRLLKTAPFILTVPINHPLAKREVVRLEDLKEKTIIVREKGSGSREVLERGLFDKNFTLEGFKSIIEIGNVNVIKKMVKDGIGISFMYKDAVLEEIARGELVEVEIEDFIIEREFNFIYLKNEIMKSDMNSIFSYLKERVEE